MVGRAPLLLLAYIVELGASADLVREVDEYNAGGGVDVLYGVVEEVVLLEYWTEMEVEGDGYETGGTDGDLQKIEFVRLFSLYVTKGNLTSRHQWWMCMGQVCMYQSGCQSYMCQTA